MSFLDDLCLKNYLTLNHLIKTFCRIDVAASIIPTIFIAAFFESHDRFNKATSGLVISWSDCALFNNLFVECSSWYKMPYV